MQKTALVTGGGSGIGQAIAGTLGRNNMRVLVLDISSLSCQETVAAIKVGGGEAYGLVADVRSAADVSRALEGVSPWADQIDVLINVAGISRKTPVLEITEKEWELVLGVHLKGTYLLTKRVVPQMVARRSGLILNMASDFARIGVPGMAHYCAAKTAIHSFTKSLARELAVHNIRVNSIAPGPIETPLFQGRLSEAEYAVKKQYWQERIPLQRLGTPSDVAGLVCWLANGGGSFINGQLLHVNGGAVM